MKNRIMYGLIIIVTFLLCLFFDSYAMKFLLAYEIILIPIDLFFLFSHKSKIQAGIKIPYYHAEKNKDFEIQVNFKNKSIFPLPFVKLELEYTNEFSGKKTIIREMVMLDGKKESTLKLFINSCSCGKFKVNISQIKIMDYLKLFDVSAKCDKSKDEFLVLPTIRQIHVNGASFNKNKHEWEKYSHTSAGEDTSEVFDVHSFRDGDTIQKIHWKLSAKANEYLVKEFSMPIEKMIILFVNMYAPKEYSQEKYDNFLEILSSLSWSMTTGNVHHSVIWYDSKDRCMNMAPIENEKDVYYMLENICNNKFYDEDIDIVNIYNHQYGQTAKGSSLMLQSNGNLLKDGRQIKAFDYGDLEKELVEWELEI